MKSLRGVLGTTRQSQDKAFLKNFEIAMALIRASLIDAQTKTQGNRKMNVITRFAPSPTGYLHIGGARTALFNYLYAKNMGGKFLLRIEDTDKDRSTEAAKEAILTSLKWLGIDWDGEVVYQSERQERHAEVAKELIDSGKAYYCFAQQEEIAKIRDEAIAQKKHFIFHSPWRDKDIKDHPKDLKPVVRIKAPREGETVVKDKLQGDVVVQNSHLDDMILLRSDGSPTYMLAVVVDDHDMKVTHIIRGDDHLSNASRQQLIYDAMGWDIPSMVHIPLIHGPDGAKLSKRHGALGAEDYKDMGYLPEALCNYLLRLGWAHGDDEIISREQAIKWFGIEGLGKSPARLDFDKMKHLNANYLRAKSNEDLANIIFQQFDWELSRDSKANILAAMESIKPRAQLVTDLQDLAKIYVVDKEIEISPEAIAIIKQTSPKLINEIIKAIDDIINFHKDGIKEALETLATANEMKLGELMKYIRCYLTGSVNSPSVFEIIAIIGKEHTIKRLKSGI
jgi:glutamyl-tRNA synthetase